MHSSFDPVGAGVVSHLVPLQDVPRHLHLEGGRVDHDVHQFARLVGDIGKALCSVESGYDLICIGQTIMNS